MTAPADLSAIVDLGSVVPLTFTTSVDGTATDPTSISLLVRDPTGATTNFTPLRDDVGSYHYDFTPTLPGQFLYRWVATGVAAGALDGSFLVEDAFSLSASYQPTPDQVHALIAQRPAFTGTSKPTLTEVQYLIEQRTADVLGELDGSDVPINLFGLAQRTIALGAAADIESGYYPEQQLADSQHASLTARYLQALSRFQQLLAAQGGGPVRVGTVRGISATLQAATDQAALLGLPVTTTNALPDAWYAGY